MKLSPGSVLVVASHNSGKLREIGDLLSRYRIETRSAAELNLSEPEETGATFTENALLKARAAAEASGLLSLADDSGLAVTALDGAPGIYSARWAGDEKNFSKAIARVGRELESRGADDRSAKFVCALALATPSGETDIFEGEVRGHLEFPPRGSRGFGYDPIFVADGMTQSFGEIAPAQKHAISHRARAFEKLLAATGLSNLSEP
jgi:XTP/dITP diphosphohydrolase